jgi:uncharacterized membrane protein YhaH (DUF805 family)
MTSHPNVPVLSATTQGATIELMEGWHHERLQAGDRAGSKRQTVRFMSTGSAVRRKMARAMTFANAVRTCLRKYVTFSGRASRSEYWWFALFVFLGSLAMAGVDALLFGTTQVETAPGQFTVEANGPLGGLFALGTFLPGIAAAWRRMHDSGRSGLHVLYPLIVMVGIATTITVLGGLGAIQGGEFGLLAAFILIPAMLVLMASPLIVIWWLTRPSEPGPNKYGPNPHEVTQ